MRAELSPEERRAAVRLKSIYISWKVATGNTQALLAELMRCTQPTVNQYLNGVIPLNLDVVVRFAEIFQVPPTDIFPEKAALLKRVLTKIQEATLPIMGTISGAAPSTQALTVANITLPTNGYSIHVDSDIYAPHIAAGTYLLINPLGVLKPDSKVIFREVNTENYILAWLDHIKGGKVHFRHFVTTKKFSRTLDSIRTLHVVCGEQSPLF